jgi:hypothetical protein
LSRAATPDERQAMVRALLADRFKLVTHMESREQETYDLVLARADHRLGPNIKPSERGCDAKIAAELAAMQAAISEGPDWRTCRRTVVDYCRERPHRCRPSRDSSQSPAVGTTSTRAVGGSNRSLLRCSRRRSSIPKDCSVDDHALSVPSTGLSDLKPGRHEWNDRRTKKDREHERQEKRELDEVRADAENVGGGQTQHERSDGEVRLIYEGNPQRRPTDRTLQLKLERDGTRRNGRGTAGAAGFVFGHRELEGAD